MSVLPTTAQQQQQQTGVSNERPLVIDALIAGATTTPLKTSTTLWWMAWNDCDLWSLTGLGSSDSMIWKADTTARTFDPEQDPGSEELVGRQAYLHFDALVGNNGAIVSQHGLERVQRVNCVQGAEATD